MSKFKISGYYLWLIVFFIVVLMLHFYARFQVQELKQDIESINTSLGL